MAIIDKSILKKSVMIRKSSIRSFNEFLMDVDHTASFLSDEQSSQVKRIVLSRYLDFPNTLGRARQGSLRKLGKECSDLDEFFELNESVILFMEPWALRGAIELNSSYLVNVIWKIIDFSDGDIKMYSQDLSVSFIIYSDDGVVKYMAHF